MIGDSPLGTRLLFTIGPLPITEEVVTTWGLMLVIGLVAHLGTRRLQIWPGTWQAALEATVATIEAQIRDVMQRDPAPYLPLIGTLFLFIATANLAALVPGVDAPTAHIETPAALALIVFVAVHVFGIRAQGLGAYLARYARPNPLLLPLNIVSEITRTFSLMVRLFGNIMSHEIMLGIVVALAGLLVPIPFMALSILIGLIQAYIFTILATVFIAAGIGAVETG